MQRDASVDYAEVFIEVVYLSTIFSNLTLT